MNTDQFQSHATMLPILVLPKIRGSWALCFSCLKQKTVANNVQYMTIYDHISAPFFEE